MTTTSSADSVQARLRADVLVEALPYIRRFTGKRVVVKLGGNAMSDPELALQFAADVVLMRSVGIQPVVVHGGGPQIGELMTRLGKEPEFRDGLRVTDAETLDIARMVLGGRVNREIVSAINAHDRLGVGLSGEDAGLLIATQRDAALGYVGQVQAVNPDVLETLLGAGFIPVVSTLAGDGSGQAYNVNADAAAIAIAAAVGAEKLVYLTDVPGVLEEVDDPTSLLSHLSAARAQTLIAAGVIAGGMIPKLEACLDAVALHVQSSHILDGRIPHVLLLELFTDAGVGTMITRQ